MIEVAAAHQRGGIVANRQPDLRSAPCFQIVGGAPGRPLSVCSTRASCKHCEFKPERTFSPNRTVHGLLGSTFRQQSPTTSGGTQTANAHPGSNVFSSEIADRVSRQCSCSRSSCRYKERENRSCGATFHIACAASVNTAVDQRGTPRILVPSSCVTHRKDIDMAVESKLLAWFVAKESIARHPENNCAGQAPARGPTAGSYCICASAFAIGARGIRKTPWNGLSISMIRKTEPPIAIEQRRNATTTVALRGALRPKLAKITATHDTKIASTTGRTFGP